jgi:hypothetical protein
MAPRFSAWLAAYSRQFSWSPKPENRTCPGEQDDGRPDCIGSHAERPFQHVNQGRPSGIRILCEIDDRKVLDRIDLRPGSAG